MDQLLIDERIYGFPGVGYGGYLCGLVAERLGGAAEVWLRRPPPLAQPLDVVSDDGALRVLDGGAIVAEGRPFADDIRVPVGISFEEAGVASRRYKGFGRHRFPMCFGCGPERSEGQGLRIFPGPVEGRDLVAAPWIPTPGLAGAHGAVAPEFLWAALDCPTVWAHPALADYADRPAALGRMVGRAVGSIAVGERCVVIGWPLGSDGRKSTAGAAVFGEDGSLRAAAEAVWIRLT